MSCLEKVEQVTSLSSYTTKYLASQAYAMNRDLTDYTGYVYAYF